MALARGQKEMRAWIRLEFSQTVYPHPLREPIVTGNVRADVDSRADYVLRSSTSRAATPGNDTLSL
jgi:hypothetical protein